jgi:endoglycosylceramidase
MRGPVSSRVLSIVVGGLVSTAGLGVVGCGDPAGTPPTPDAGEPPRPDGWHVRAGFLRDPDGRAAILRGVNLAGAHKVAPYLDDKLPADYARVRADWGFNSIRFLMTWAAVEPTEGVYDDAYLDRVAERMQWAADAGLAVVIDMHEDIYGEGFGFDGAPRWTCDESYYEAFVPRDPWFLSALDPNVQACVDDFFANPAKRTAFAAAWRHVAERLADAPAVVGFDALNEPNWGTYPPFQFEQDRLRPFYDEVVAAVRAAAPSWIAFLEPSASRNGGIPTGLTGFDFANVVYAPHSYDTNAEGGGGFDPRHRQAILDNVAFAAIEADVMDAALWIGEYGGDASQPGIVEYMTAQYDAAGAVAAGTMYWAYDKSDGYGLLAPDGSEKPLLVETLVRPYPMRVAGDPGAYRFDAATRTFTFTYTPDLAITAPTELAVPARVYPDGYAVACGGCAARQEPGVLVIDAPAAGAGTVEVQLTPTGP